MRQLDGTTDLKDVSLSKLPELDRELPDGPGSLACCSPLSCEELDTNERLSNNKELIHFVAEMKTTL